MLKKTINSDVKTQFHSRQGQEKKRACAVMDGNPTVPSWSCARREEGWWGPSPWGHEFHQGIGPLSYLLWSFRPCAGCTFFVNSGGTVKHISIQFHNAEYHTYHSADATPRLYPHHPWTISPDQAHLKEVPIKTRNITPFAGEITIL